jgi:alpha,alpha-trehalose phosphorylase (configuration-retaining)
MATTLAFAPNSAQARRRRPQFKSIVYDEVYPTHWDPVTRKVTVTTTLTIAQIRASISEADWNYVCLLARRFRGKRMVIINSALKGGGVVIMRKPLIVLLQLLGVDVDWYVLKPNLEASMFTKWSIHNVLQNVPGLVPMTEEGKEIYRAWIAEEFAALREVLAEADVFICDDWQPSGLIPYIKREGFKCVILFRDHIQTQGVLMVTPGTPQFDTWNFLWGDNQICDVNVFITHPRDIFVPPNVHRRMVAYMPATVEPNDDLLRDVTDVEITAERAWLNYKFTRWGNSPVNWSRRYIILVARFDESKNMEGALEYYARARQRLLDLGVPAEKIPQLVLVGNGATDDPSGKRMLAKIRLLVRTKYRSIKADIHVARVPHRDLALNVLLRSAWIALQPSIAEGFESRATDAIWLGVPVLGSTEGGISLQILVGKSGFVFSPHDIDKWVECIVDLATDEAKYQRLRETTKEAAKTHNVRFTTPKNAISWLTLALMALEQPGYQYNHQWADRLDYELAA